MSQVIHILGLATAILLFLSWMEIFNASLSKKQLVAKLFGRLLFGRLLLLKKCRNISLTSPYVIFSEWNINNWNQTVKAHLHKPRCCHQVWIFMNTLMYQDILMHPKLFSIPIGGKCFLIIWINQQVEMNY